MSKLLLDTDICSYILKRTHPSLLARLRGVPPDNVRVSVISKAELLYRVEISPRREKERIAVEAFLKQVQILDLPDAAAVHYAEIRAELKRRGTLIGANDLLLAAHARSLGMTLITNNTREFRRVSGLLLDNWTTVS